MEEAGMADYEHDLISIDDTWRKATSDAAAAMLRDAGINVNRTVLPGSTFWNDWAKYPLSTTDWAQRPLGVQVLALAYRSGEPWNESAFSNAEFDSLLEDALAIADAEKRGVHLGAKLAARAWADPAFKERLLKDGPAACDEIGIDIKGSQLLVVENTSAVHNLVVCTLCSCYPVMLLGPSPEWYKSKAYRARSVWDPRGVLSEFGTNIPLNREVRVHDSTADMRYMVLPMRPKASSDLNEDQLAQLISLEGLIGTREI